MSLVRYELGFGNLHAHLIDVRAHFADLTGDYADLHMAAWTPGSYLVRDYARHLQDLVCTDDDGRVLHVTKLDKASFRVALGGAPTLHVTYRVFAHELTVRTSHVDGSHAFVNGAPTFLWLEERKHEPIELAVDAPAGWRVATALAGGPRDFVAADLDELIDSPLHLGPGPVRELEAAGRPTVLAVWGRPEEGAAACVADLERDLVKIVEAHARVFGGVPYDRYTFLLMFAPGAYGGLEHHRSTALLASAHAFATRKRYEELLELVSHEYFHLWNVKRIHPRALGPFEYTRECYTRSLWLAEGLTSYYDRLTLRRAGVQTARRYLDKLADEWGNLLAIPGRNKQSIEESSFDAWIKLYRPDENTVNSTVSYYLKGGLVSLVLDLEIRRRSNGRRSLDDVLVHLWREYGEKERGYADGDVQREIERAVELELGPFFDRHVRGREDPELEGALAGVGLKLRAKVDKPEGEEPRPAAWLGVNTKNDGGRAIVSASLADGPAERAGLYAGDELVALDGFRVEDKNLGDRLAARRPGDRVQVTVFRRDELLEVQVTLGEKLPSWEIVPAERPSDAERAAYHAWLGEELAPVRPS